MVAVERAGHQADSWNHLILRGENRLHGMKPLGLAHRKTSEQAGVECQLRADPVLKHRRKILTNKGLIRDGKAIDRAHAGIGDIIDIGQRVELGAEPAFRLRLLPVAEWP